VSVPLVAVIDYGAGNLQSVSNALRHLGVDHFLASRPEQLREAPAMIFPGVGEAAASMANLRGTGLDEAIRRFHASGRKMLGICIGCQVIFERSEEGDTPCLGILPGTVRRFPRVEGLKVPHMGWNQLAILRQHPVFEGVPDHCSFYFVHSYYPSPAQPGLAAGETEYGVKFPAAVAKDNLIAFQFHLEKSGPMGLRLLSNFLRWAEGDAQPKGGLHPRPDALPEQSHA
jgi:imidazole glycerol-phosphate synthase subunit HisH